jgi:hypothetical protein
MTLDNFHLVRDLQEQWALTRHLKKVKVKGNESSIKKQDYNENIIWEDGKKG